MNTTIKNIFLRTLLCGVLFLAWGGVKAQTETTYTIYFDNSTANWSSVHAKIFINWDESNVVVDDDMTNDESTGYYKLTFTTNSDMSTASCTIYDGGGSGEGLYWVTFENEKVYTYGSSSDTGLTTEPADGANVLTEMSSFTVSYYSTISINENASDKTIKITCDEEELTDVYLKPEVSAEGNSVTFSFYSDASLTTPTSLSTAGTYVITIPEGYFLLGEEKTPSDAITLTYTIGKYTFYFDKRSIWWGDPLYAVVYYYDGSGNKVYCLGSETNGTVTWVEGTMMDPYEAYDENGNYLGLQSDIYYWNFTPDEDIPEDKTVYVEFQASEGSWKVPESDNTAPEFVNGHVYMYNSAHYPYDTFFYDEYYGGSGLHIGVDVSTVNVTHKAPKWSGSVDSSHDTFNKDVTRVNSYGGNLSGDGLLQAANTYVETLYVLKGSTVQLTLPYTLYGGVAANAYHRWFDFRTDGNYRYGDYDDLLRPTGVESNSGYNSIYRFANGYVCGSADVQNSNATYAMDFYYPTDDEFTEEIRASIPTTDNAGYLQRADNNFYIVACEVSPYTDYDWTESDDGTGTYTEPTLSGRALYYIVGIDPESTSTTAPNGLPSDLQTMWRLREEGYTGGGNTSEDNYLEEYDIVFPARRTSNNTLELVTLSKDASSYIVPGVEDSSGTLSVKFDEGDSNKGFNFKESTLQGENRVIQFYNTGNNNEYSNAASGAPWNVDDGTELTILVTKNVSGTDYNIARYHLTFKEDATPLTQTQVAGLGTEATSISGYWWKDMTYRQPSYMNRNYNKIASLTFDYGSSSDVSSFDPDAQSGFHYFPMDWENTSYAFNDGSTAATGNSYPWFAPGTPEPSDPDYLDPTRTVYTQWSMYSIVDCYIGFGDSQWVKHSTWDANGTETITIDEGNGLRPDDKPEDTDDYWLYIDASDRPGSVAEISFDDPICVGTQVFGTALIKSASEPTSGDAAVLFSIVGVDAYGNHTTLYSQCSSQIRMTTYLNNSEYGADEVDENGLSGDITGKGSEKNEWFQLYFSFYSTERQNFDHYALKIDNYCSSTSGGDYYFDDIELYVVQPTFIVEQIAPICTSDEQVASAMRLMVDFEMIEARLGDTMDEDKKSAEDTSDDTVDFMIIDMVKYDNYFSENTSASPENVDDVAAAITASVVQFVYKDSNDENQSTNYVTLNFYVDDKYSGYPVYNGEERVAGENTYDVSNGYFFLHAVDGEEYLAIDCFADISPYRPYKILLLHDDSTISEETYAELFAACIDDKCEIAFDFYLTSSTILRINGEAADPTVDYCAGQTVVIQPDVTYTDDGGNTVTVKGEYFDWFFGTEEEYTSPVIGENEEEMFGGVTLQEALLMFREYYPTATELSATDTPVTGEDETDFTQDMYDIIEYYLGQTNEGSYHARLVLYQQKFSVVIPTTELDLVVQPIEVTVYEYDEDGSIKADDDGNPIVLDVCFGYVPLTLGVGGEAPTFNAGFHNVEYPGDDFVPSIRLGLSQITQASQAKSGSDTATPITVNLRNARYYADESEDESADESEEVVDHLGVYTSDDGTMNGLYLVGTDDPDYEEALSDEYFTQYSLPIGKVLDLYAKEDDTEGASYMKIAFYDEYPLREGYTYTVMVNCEEKDADGASVNGVCQGTLPIEIKVVPECLVWTGGSTSNWNNDSNWQRVSSTRINATNNDEESPYFTDGNNTNTNGFVPMLFSKVVMPEDSEAELYMSGFMEMDVTDDTGTTSSKLVWEGDEDSTTDEGDDDDDDDGTTNTSADVPERPTPYIMYDMMVYNTEDGQGNIESMMTEHYRVNLCSQLHLEPGAQLLHSELLLAETVWTEVKIPQGKWQLVATPLGSVYSGDWYTKKATGTETAEYFTDITFDGGDEGGNDALNDRYDPDVYQRSWDKTGTIVVSSSSDNKETPAYISTGWTSAYNDASEPFTPGVGFSLEGWWGTNSEDSIMFRFPKADTSYAYSTSADELDRTGAGTLLISGLVDRTEPDKDGGNVYTGDPITVTLPENEDGNEYYLVGNPFTAAMSMSAFMARNDNVAAYWAESPDGPVAGGSDPDSYDDYLLPPYTGFFITFKEEDGADPTVLYADSPMEISFTEDMQVLTTDLVPTDFYIGAGNEVGSSKAYVAYSGSASDGYMLGEDVPLLEDVSWRREGLPIVYTVAGDMAVSINTLSTATVIPIGAFADDGCAYTLTFVGTDKLIDPALYDAYDGSETPLTEGYTLALTGASHGQYFIRVAAPATTGISEDHAPVYDITAYSPAHGTVVVCSSAELENVDVYSVGGMLLRHVNAGGNITCTINGLNSGIAIVRARTSEGTFVKKLLVR